MFKKDPIILFIGSILLFAFTAFLIYKEGHPEWRAIQSRFSQEARLAIGQQRADTIDTGIQQIYIPSLHRVDRCITCHQGYDIPGMEKAKEPFTTHPDLPFMKEHGFLKYGCTICHGGQGYATTVRSAHGRVADWNEPLLDKKMGERYGLKNPGHIMEINCNTCHRDNRSVAWMDYINEAKQLVQEKGCRTCHIINGQGGRIGPDLTYEGDKNPEIFDFSNVKKGPKTAFNWLYQHFKDPAAITKGSVMPNFGFTDEQARALTMLVLSWRKISLPYDYIPKAGELMTGTEQGTKNAGEAKQTTGHGTQKVAAVKAPVLSALQEQGKTVFETKGCTACHTIGKGKLVGPDLKGVTRTRTNAWLENWLKNTSKMQATDPVAKKLVQEYKVPMPQQNLTDQQIHALIDYFRSTITGK